MRRTPCAPSLLLRIPSAGPISRAREQGDTAPSIPVPLAPLRLRKRSATVWCLDHQCGKPTLAARWQRTKQLPVSAVCTAHSALTSRPVEELLLVPSMIRNLRPRATPWLSHRESARSAGDLGLIPGSGRSPGEGNGYPLQFSGLGSPMGRRAWRAIVHGVAKSWTRLSD